MGSRLKRAGMTALFGAFTLIGLAMALFGQGSDRLMGVATALFFGVGGAAWFVITAPPGRVPGFRPGRVGRFGSIRSAFVVDYARGSAVIGGVALLAMAAATVLLFIVSLGDGAGIVERALFLGAGVLFAAFGIFGLMTARVGSRLALTRDGVHLLSAAGEVFVPWDAITEIGEVSVHDNPFLALRVRSPDDIRMGQLQRLAHSVQRSMMGVDVTVPLRPLLVEPAELTTALERYVTVPEARVAVGSAEELATIRQTGPYPERT